MIILTTQICGFYLCLAPKTTQKEIVLDSDSEDYIAEEDQILMDTNNDIE